MWGQGEASWSVVGHDATLRLLGQALAQDRLAHAYLLAGPPHVGKSTLALDLARAVNCQGPAPPCGACGQCQRISLGRHTDVVVLGVEEVAGHKAISIDAVRDLQHQAHLKPYEGACRVFIIEGAELLTEAAANALLKNLEEPPDQVLLVLTTVDPELLLPTIRSRCQQLDLRPLPETRVAEALESRWGASPEEAGRLARLCRGCIGWAIQALQDPAILETRARRLERVAALSSASLEERFAYAADLAALMPQQRTALRETLDVWATWWRDALIAQAGSPELALDQEGVEAPIPRAWGLTSTKVAQAIRDILHVQQLLEANVNPRLALEGLMLSLPRVPAGKGDA